MALFNLARKPSGFSNALAVLKSRLIEENHVVFDPEASINFVGIESADKLTHSEIARMEGDFENTKGIIGNALSALDEAEMGLSTVGIESATRTAIMLGDTGNFFNKLKSDLGSVGVESFSKEELRKYRDESILVSAFTADDTPVISAIYPTVEVGVNYAGVEMRLRRFVQVGVVEHKTDGSITDFNRTHIANAYRSGDSLDSVNNKLYPIVVAGTNEAMFIAPTKVATSVVPTTDGWRTAPLKPTTEEINLLGITRPPGVNATSSPTYNDRIDAGARFKNLHIGVGIADGMVKINLDQFNTAQFTMTNTGSNNRSVMNFSSDQLNIPLANTAIAELVAVRDADYDSITLKLNINAELNLHTGSFQQQFGSVTISGVYKNGDDENYVTDAALTAALAAIAPKYLGFDIDATLSSKTLRLEGTRVDDQTLPYAFPMTARPVITADKAVTEDDIGEILQVMSSTEVIQREAAAVSNLFDSIESFGESYGVTGASNVVGETTSSMPGLAFINRPWVKVQTINIGDIVDSESSSNRFADISASLVNLLGDNANSMVTETNYVESKRLYRNDQGLKAKFAILTTPQIGRYLAISGDERTFGGEHSSVDASPRLATSINEHFDDTIVMVPCSDDASANSFDEFGFGNTLKAPSLVYDVQLTRGDSHKRHLQIQPFYTFTNNVPMVYKLKVNGLTEYLAEKTSVLTVNSNPV